MSKDQQINGLADPYLASLVDSDQNKAETGKRADTPVTQRRSRHVRLSRDDKEAIALEMQQVEERARYEKSLGRGEVYFLYSCNMIKIGTSIDAQRRIMQDIAPCCPSPLKLIGILRGGRALEAQFHERFAAARFKDEWFELTAELRAFLCEDDERADRLEDAEDDYKAWLEDELANLERTNEDPPDQPGGGASRAVSHLSKGAGVFDLLPAQTGRRA